MSRLASANQTQSDASSNFLVVFVELQFPSGTVRFASAPKDLTFSSNTFTPSNRFLGLSGLQERSDLKLGAIEIMLSHESANLTAIEDDYQYSLVKTWIGFINQETYALVTDPEPMGSFYMSMDSVEENRIVLTCEPVTQDVFDGTALFPSPNTQSQRYASDTIFDAVQAIQGLEFEWAGNSWIVGGAGGCVCIDMDLPSGKASDVSVGDWVDMPDGKANVTFSERKTMPCVRIETEGGTILECSTSAPIMTTEGLIKAPFLTGKRVHILRGLPSTEEVISVLPIGDREVQHISIDDQCFWAGKNGFILHHNKLPTFSGGRDSVGRGGNVFSPGATPAERLDF